MLWIPDRTVEHPELRYPGRPPLGPMRFARSSPWARGGVGCWPMRARRDLTGTHKAFTLSGSADIISGPHGPALDTTAGSNAMLSCGTTDAVPAPPISVFVLAHWSGNNSHSQALISKRDTDDAADMRWSLYWNKAPKGLRLVVPGNIVQFGVDLQSGLHSYGVSLSANGATPVLYIDGVFAANGDDTFTFGSDAGSEVTVGNFPGGGFQFEGLTYLAYMTRADLREQEFHELHHRHYGRLLEAA